MGQVTNIVEGKYTCTGQDMQLALFFCFIYPPHTKEVNVVLTAFQVEPDWYIGLADIIDQHWPVTDIYIYIYIAIGLYVSNIGL